MTRMTKTLLSAACILGVAAPALAGDTFTVRFDYDTSASASDNMQRFEAIASDACSQQIAEAGFRKTDSTRFQQRKCERQLLKSATSGKTMSRMLGAFAAKTTNAINGDTTQRRTILISRKSDTPKPVTTLKMASNTAR